MKKPSSEKKYFALFLLAVLFLFFFYAAIPLLLGISGAAILYVLLRPTYTRLSGILKNRSASAAITLLLSFLLFVIPLILIVYVIALNLFVFFSNPENINHLVSLVSSTTANFDVLSTLKENIGVISGVITQVSFNTLNAFVGLVVNLLVMYIILYYLFVEQEKSSRLMLSILPFSEKNAKRLSEEFHNVINATFFSNGVVAIIIGLLMAAGLYLAGAENIVFWAAASIIAAIIPIIGLQIIWIPAGIYYILYGNLTAGIEIMLWGAFLSYLLDGYLRQLVQRRIASIHPFVSIIGLLIGITYFGITGIIIGPLLLSLFVLTAKMFREEYLPDWD